MKNFNTLMFTLAIAGCASSTPSAEGPSDKAAAVTSSIDIPKLLEGYANYNRQMVDSDLWADDIEFVSVDNPMPVNLKGREAVAKYVGTKIRDVYPDLQLVPARVLALDANTVLVEAVMQGTNSGAFATGMPATNKKVGLTVAHLYTFDDAGKVTKLEAYANGMTMMIQLGLMPPPMGTVPPLAAAPAQAEVVTEAGDAAALDVVQKVDEAFFKSHDWSVLNGLIAEDVQVGLPVRKDLSGLETIKKTNEPFAKAMSESEFKYHKRWTVGPYVVSVIEHTATHSAKLGPFEATNKRFKRMMVDVSKVEDGKITTSASYANPLGALKQLGLFPPPKPKEAATQPSAN